MTGPFDSILDSHEFGEEFFVAEFQSRLANMLDDKGISRAELSRKLGVSRARVTQIFSDEASNFTLRLLFRSFGALGEEPVILTKGEYLKLRKQAEASERGSAAPSSRGKVSEDGVTAALLAELLKTGVVPSEAEHDRPLRRSGSSRAWAEAGSNVIPLRERASG